MAHSVSPFGFRDRHLKEAVKLYKQRTHAKQLLDAYTGSNVHTRRVLVDQYNDLEVAWHMVRSLAFRVYNISEADIIAIAEDKA